MTHPNEAYETKIKFTDMKDFIKKDLKFDVAPANLSDTEVVDFIVYLRELKSTVEAREKLLGEVLKTRFASGLNELKETYEESGEKAYLSMKGDQTPGLVYEYVVQQRLDTAAIEAEMGSDWMEEHKKPTTFFQARVTKG